MREKVQKDVCWLYASTVLRGSRALAFGVAALASPAHANPIGGTVSAGSAAIQGQGTPVVQVNQSSDRAVIDWQSFNIAPGEITRFRQPSVTSAILNRIHDQNPSQILGNLTANGQVMLVNPNGMLFGKGSRVDVSGLVATSADMVNQSFMNARPLLFGLPGLPDASVINRGTITVKEAGLAALVAPNVSNEGVISATAGKVALASGDTVAVDIYGDKLISVAASDKLKRQAVTQSGRIEAAGGEVLLTTAQAAQLIDQAVNMDGLVDVSSLKEEAGGIVLHAEGGNVNVRGELRADSAKAQGGQLQVTGENVRVHAGAFLSASGAAGGGDIRIGGDYLGGGDTPRARTTGIAKGAEIKANATEKGDGGRVIVWSDGKTDFAGLIQAKGGLAKGDGGFIETSSKDVLVAHGLADASAPKGKGGEWLLDPRNITISTGATSNIAGDPDWVSTGNSAVLNRDSVETALDGGTSVTVTTGGTGAQAGNITVADDIVKGAGGDASLTLKAHNNIAVNADIGSTSNKLHVTLWADSENDGNGGITMTNATINTLGGNVVLGGGTDPAADEAVGTGNYGVEFNNSDITTGAGNISLRGRGEGTGDTNIGVIIHTGSVLQTTTGNITLVGTGGNGTDDNAGIMIRDPGTQITTTDGDILLNGTGGNGSSTGNYGIATWDNIAISSTGTGAGAGTITLIGAGRGTGEAVGVGIMNASSITSVDGDIQITGTSTGTSSDNSAVLVVGDSSIASTGTGANAADIDIDGTASDDGTDYNYGVSLLDAGTSITTVDGDIEITGTGGDGTAADNTGINIFGGAVVTSTGTGADAGNIALAGTGGTGTQYSNGILVDGAAYVSAVDGDIILTGTGGTATADQATGVVLFDGGAVRSTGAGAGNISIIGTAGAAAGGDDYGVWLTTNAEVTAAGSGTITMTGTGGAVSITDIKVVTGANIIGGAAAGDVTLIGNTMDFANLTASSAGNIALQTRTAGATVGLAGGAGALNLTTAELNFFNPGGAFIIGAADSGNLTVNARNWGGEDVQFRSGGAGVINVAGAQSNIVDFTITTDADPTVGAAITGTGVLTLETATAATTMGLGGGAGTLNYSSADLTALGATWASYVFGSTTQTGTLTTAAHTWANPVTWRSAAGGNIAISGLQDTTAASDTTFTFSGPTTLGANVSTAAATGGTQDITFNDDVTLTGNAQVLAGNGDLSVAGTIDGAFDLTLNAAGTITLSDDIGAGTPLDDLTITSDADPTIGGTVDGTGILTLQQASNATTMGVAGGAGALNYSLAELAALGPDWTSMRFGSTTATGALTVGANAWDSPVTYRAAAAGSIVVTGAQTAVAASDTNFTFSGPTTLSANVSTVAATGGTQDITFSDDVTLTGNAQVLAGNGDLAVAGTIDGAFDLTLNAAGTITLSDDIGAGTALDDLTIASDADPTIGGTVDGTGVLTLQQASNATTMGVAGGAGALNYSLADLAGLGTDWTSLRLGSTTATGALTVGANAWGIPVTYRSAAAGSIVISGAQTAVAASDTTFTFSGPTTLGANVSTAAATGGTQDITFNDDMTLTANAQVLAGNGDLSIAGTIDGAFDLVLSAVGIITLSDDIGAGTPLDDLTLTSDANPTIGGTVDGTGILTLQQASNATTMGVAGGAGALNYSVADLAGLGADWTAVRLGSTTATGTLTVGARAWENPVEYRAAAAGSIVISGAQTAVAASDTTFTFSGPTTLGANVSTAAATGGTQDITFNDDVTLTGNAQVLAGNGDLSVASTIDGAFDLTLNAAGTITLSDDIGAGTPLDDLTITSDADPTIGGAVEGTGVLTLQQASNATTMGVAGGAGALNYSVADLAGLGAGWTSVRLGSTTATGALTVGARAWDVPVDYRAAAAGSIAISGAQTAVAASDTTFTFSGPTTLGANVSTAAATGGTQDITFNDDVTLTGNAQVLAGNGDLLFSGTIDGAFDLTLSAAGSITLADDLGAGTPLDDLTLTSDADPTIGGTVDGTGILTLQQASNATTMGVAGGAGALNYALADLAALGSNWTSLRFGSPTATGALTVGANAWNSPVDYRAAAAGSIVVTGAQTVVAASDTIFTFSGPTSLGATVSTVNATGGTQDITFNDDVTLTANVQVLAGNGDLSFASTIDGAFDLTLNAAGTITLSDDIGAGTPLDDLTITSDADPTIGGAVEGTGVLTLQQASNATTMGVAGGAGALNYSVADLAGLGAGWTSVRLGSTTATGALTVGARAWDVPVDYRAAAAGSIAISGAQTAVAASDTIFTFSGPATLNAALDLTNATGGTQAITFNDSAAVNADITSGGGDVAFNDTLSLGADILTGGGDITLADDVTLTGTSSIDTDTPDIAFAGTLDGTFALTLTTTGDADFSGDVGTGTALGDLAITGAADVTFAGGLHAASVTLTGGTGAVMVTGAADITNDIDLTTTDAVTFDDDLAFGGDMTIDSGAGAIAFSGTVDGPGDVNLSTTDDITFGDNVGAGAALGGIVIADAADVTFSGTLEAGSVTLAGGTGAVLVTGAADLNGDIDLTTTGAVTFGDAVTYGGDVAVDSGASDITFNGTVDGPGDMELTTTNDILFAGDVGGVTRLGDVVIDPRHFTAGAFNAASFTFTNGTGNVTFGGTGLNTTGNIGIDTNGNVTGTYAGANGLFDAGAGSITATVSFTGLDIAGAGATLSAGYIGALGAADQTMANLISIDGMRNPWPMGIPSPAYTFAGFQIGGAAVMGGGGGGSHTPPVSPPDPGNGPGPVTPPVTEPGGQPVTSAPDTSFNPLLLDIARLQCSAEMMVQSAKLPAGAACGAASASASWDAVLQSR